MKERLLEILEKILETVELPAMIKPFQNTMISNLRSSIEKMSEEEIKNILLEVEQKICYVIFGDVENEG